MRLTMYPPARSSAAAREAAASARSSRCGARCGIGPLLVRRGAHGAAVIDPRLNASDDVDGLLRLGQESVGAELLGVLRELVRGAAGEEHERRVRAEARAAELEDRAAGERGQAQVDEDEIWIELPHDERQRDDRAVHGDFDALVAEQPADAFEEVRLVIDDQHFPAAHAATFTRSTSAASDSGCSGLRR